MKLQDRGKQIDGLSARINIHMNALQMSLQIATIKIALATPDFVIRELREALRDIRKLLGGAEDINHRPLRLSSVKGDDEDQLVGLAQDALRHGTTLYEASVAGSTVGADSVMGSEKAVSVGKWIHETGGVAQDMHATRTARSYLAYGASNPRTSTVHSPVEYAISEASSSSEAASNAGSSLWDNSRSESLPLTEKESTPIVNLSDLRTPAMVAQDEPPGIACPSTPRLREPTEWGKQLRTQKHVDVLSRFNLRPEGRIEMKKCTGTQVDPRELWCLKESEQALPVNIDGGGDRERNKNALHFAVLSQDLHLVKSLVYFGYCPNLSAQISDVESLSGLRTPIEIAIASHCQPITEVLLKHGAQLSPKHGSSPCLQLFAPSSLNQWPSTDVDTYTGVLNLLLARFKYPYFAASRPILHQICDLPTAWFHLLALSPFSYCGFATWLSSVGAWPFYSDSMLPVLSSLSRTAWPLSCLIEVVGLLPSSRLGRGKDVCADQPAQSAMG
jgi:hypothetical protein